MTSVSSTDIAPAGSLGETRYAWRISDSIILGVAAYLLDTLFLFFIIRTLQTYPLGFSYTSYQFSLASTLVTQAATLLVLTPFVIATIRLRKLGTLMTSIGWNRVNRYLTWAIFCGAAFATVNCLAMAFVRGSTGYSYEYHQGLSIGLYLLVAVCLEPVMEEVYFRGILFVALSQKLGTTISIILVTSLFAYMHPGGRLFVLPVAIVLGATRLVTNSVASCVGLHASYNLFLLFYQLYTHSNLR